MAKNDKWVKPRRIPQTRPGAVKGRRGTKITGSIPTPMDEPTANRQSQYAGPATPQSDRGGRPRTLGGKRQ